MINMFNKPEPNIAKSPYRDLTIIQEGTYHSKIVSKPVARDAEKLFEAIYGGDHLIIEKIIKNTKKNILLLKNLEPQEIDIFQ